MLRINSPCRYFDLPGLRGHGASHCLYALISTRTTLLSLRENRIARLAGAEEPALIAKILGHVRAREELGGLEARAPPVDRTDKLELR